VFTGDNPKLTAFLSGQARERENLFNADYKKRRTLLNDKADPRMGLSAKELQHRQTKVDANAAAD